MRPIVARGYKYDVDTGRLTVTGENFTPFSVVALDGEKAETEFVDRNTIVATLDDPPYLGQIITVCQDTKRGLTLSQTVGILVG